MFALALDATEDQAAHGLRLLRTTGLVAEGKQSRIVYYRLAQDFSEPVGASTACANRAGRCGEAADDAGRLVPGEHGGRTPAGAAARRSLGCTRAFRG